MTASHRVPEFVCLFAAIALAVAALYVRLSVPTEIENYVSTGFLLPASDYSLLLPLLACGFVFASQGTMLLIVSIVFLILSLMVGLQLSEVLIAPTTPLVVIALFYPLITIVVGIALGGVLLLPRPANGWFGIIAAIFCGLGLGLTIGLKSPGDNGTSWFLASGALGGLAVVLGALALGHAAQHFATDNVLEIVGRILGSWLIAANLMLAAVTLTSERSVQLPAPPHADLSEFEHQRKQSSMRKQKDATDF